eukprot:CAMPEP_0197043702 /NCGR_PEP_ID=MMETSP1384-20130603/19908_1 /TAXON_ID=29189 /ORGANISM="Ammonia sp." /LENGTH=280 /DNA_ID=CAMNT_0042475041 /DNA_START=21 /DNA_END=863 /DNA_ORIENTATION=+
MGTGCGACCLPMPGLRHQYDLCAPRQTRSKSDDASHEEKELERDELWSLLNNEDYPDDYHDSYGTASIEQHALVSYSMFHKYQHPDCKERFEAQPVMSYHRVLHTLFHTLCCIGLYDNKLQRWRTAVYSRHFDNTQRIVVRFVNSSYDDCGDKYFCLVGFPVDNVRIDSARFSISAHDLKDLSNLPVANVQRWMMAQKRPTIIAWYRRFVNRKYSELAQHSKITLVSGYIRYLYALEFQAFGCLRFPSYDIIQTIASWHDGQCVVDDVLTLITAFCVQSV